MKGEDLVLALPQPPRAHGGCLPSPFLAGPRIHSLQVRDQLLPSWKT